MHQCKISKKNSRGDTPEPPLQEHGKGAGRQRGGEGRERKKGREGIGEGEGVEGEWGSPTHIVA